MFTSCACDILNQVKNKKHECCIEMSNINFRFYLKIVVMQCYIVGETGIKGNDLVNNIFFEFIEITS